MRHNGVRKKQSALDVSMSAVSPAYANSALHHSPFLLELGNMLKCACSIQYIKTSQQYVSHGVSSLDLHSFRFAYSWFPQTLMKEPTYFTHHS